MPKAKYTSTELAEKPNGVAIFCPACKHAHVYRLRNPANGNAPQWDFNGNLDKPTMTPSYLTYTPKSDGSRGPTVCHFYVTEGRIKFCNDCPHELKGQTVDLPDFPDDYGI